MSKIFNCALLLGLLVLFCIQFQAAESSQDSSQDASPEVTDNDEENDQSGGADATTEDDSGNSGEAPPEEKQTKKSTKLEADKKANSKSSSKSNKDVKSKNSKNPTLTKKESAKEKSKTSKQPSISTSNKSRKQESEGDSQGVDSEQAERSKKKSRDNKKLDRSPSRDKGRSKKETEENSEDEEERSNKRKNKKSPSRRGSRRNDSDINDEDEEIGVDGESDEGGQKDLLNNIPDFLGRISKPAQKQVKKNLQRLESILPEGSPMFNAVANILTIVTALDEAANEAQLAAANVVLGFGKTGGKLLKAGNKGVEGITNIVDSVAGGIPGVKQITGTINAALNGGRKGYKEGVKAVHRNIVENNELNRANTIQRKNSGLLSFIPSIGV